MAAVTLRAAFAQELLKEVLLEKHNAIDGRDDVELPPAEYSKLLASQKQPHLEMPICIVGAGATGLATAIMLWYIGFTNVTILEASNRTGGRVYTHHFPKAKEEDEKKDEQCPHNYYDVGAMRIPQIPTMKSTFRMIDYLNKNGEHISRAEYTFKAENKPPEWYEWPKDDSGFDDYMARLLYKQGFPDIPRPDGEAEVESKTFEKAFTDFIASSHHPDRWSTRSWLMNGPDGIAPKPLWSYERTQMAETFGTATGLFDQAFMETICDWYDFQNADKVPWFRVEGGMQKLTDALCGYAIKKGTKVYTTAPVTAMQATGKSITVTYAGAPKSLSNAIKDSPSATYEAVFNTTTFGSLRRIDLQGVNLSADNLCGIRALSYDRATKVAIKFTKPWWRELLPKGGVSNTDLPISKVVYPSWDDGAEAQYTIIVSYSWAQDATRMAALMEINDMDSKDPTEPIIQLCFQNLAKLWSNSPTAAQLQEMYVAHHAFSWSRDPWAAGAYALFGPGQFEFLYSQFTKPLCENMLSICGEAVSAHHAWISGAFDSAYNAVYMWCVANRYVKQANKLKASPFGNGVDENTAELDDFLVLWNLYLDKAEKLKKGDS